MHVPTAACAATLGLYLYKISTWTDQTLELKTWDK